MHVSCIQGHQCLIKTKLKQRMYKLLVRMLYNLVEIRDGKDSNLFKAGISTSNDNIDKFNQDRVGVELSFKFFIIRYLL